MFHTHEIMYLVEKLIELLAVNQADVTFPQQPPHFTFHLVLLHVQHHQNRR